GPRLGISIGLLVLGAVIAIISTVLIVIPLFGTFTSREYATPIHLSLHLRPARYTVYERSGSTSGFGIHAGPVTIDPTQVIVRAPDGEPVDVFRPGTTETITRDSAVYTGAVQFDAPTTGDYEIRLTNPNFTTVLITRSLGDAIRSVLGWIVAGAFGAMILVAGLVMLIVGVTRRGRARRATQLGWGQPGWGQPAWGQAGWGEAGWGQPAWGQPPQYAPSQYPHPQYPPPPYPPPPPQYAPPPPPPPPSAPSSAPPDESPAGRPDDPPHDPWAPK
ncbi:MAG: hypothetical protein QOI44_1551, partial [Actinomycetota bacterium]|nr:hypothetical protein [Actinomycetota bacterium]